MLASACIGPSELGFRRSQMNAVELAMTKEDKQDKLGPGPEPWVNTLAACKYLGISRVTLRRWIKMGRLQPKRLPGGEFRFRISELDALLD